MRKSGCKFHCFVWEKEKVVFVQDEYDPLTPDSIGLRLMQVVVRCQHCGIVQRRFMEPVSTAQAKVEASQLSHGRRCLGRRSYRKPPHGAPEPVPIENLLF